MFLAQYLKEAGEDVIKVGRWWGQVEVTSGKFEDREIDVIVETQTMLYTKASANGQTKKPAGPSLTG